MNAFVEANRRSQHRLQPGVINDVVIGERLFDQDQAELVEILEPWSVGERIGRVRIDLKRQAGGAREPYARLRHPNRARSSA